MIFQKSLPARRNPSTGSPTHAPRHNSRRYFRAIESLEPRTLLSISIVSGGKSAVFTDPSGDLVTITISKGTLSSDDFPTIPAGQGDQLEEIDLSAGGFDVATSPSPSPKTATAP